MLFPKGVSSRIPIIAVTGTNGKTTVTRLLAHIVQSAGYFTGFTTTDGIYVNGELIQSGDNTGPVSTQVILKDPEVVFAVLECAPGGLLRSGLGFDQCDVGIVTNVAADHLGLGDIHTVEQMAKVKAVIPETVHEQGYAVLNAEDDLVYEMHSRVKSKVALFSLEADNARIQEHIRKGGLAAVLADGAVVILEGQAKTMVAQVADIPLTFSGTALYMVQNVLAAVLGAYTQGISVEEIRQALATFVPSATTTPGRMNVFDFTHFQFIIDYAHNPAGMQAVGGFIKQMAATPKVGIIAGVGDRRSEDIMEMGRQAAAIFDELIIRQDKDLRDREGDEIIHFLQEGIASINDQMQVTVIPDEKEAMAYAIQQASEGSVVVHFTEKVMDSIAYITQLQAEEKNAGAKPDHTTNRSSLPSQETHKQNLPEKVEAR
jgi:cyanophycin synthetase